MDVSIIRRTLLAAGALAGVCVLAGCGGAPPPARPVTAAHGTASASRPAVTRVTMTRSRPSQPPPQPRVRITSVRTADGDLVNVAVFLGPVRYVLHDGSADPAPVRPAAGLRAGPVVAGAESRQLLAAFNGGFKLAAASGYMQEGHVLSPLRAGLASLVIDRSGQARIGVWGCGLPAPGEAVYNVRRNLPPPVLNGRPTAAAAERTLWGATLGGGAYVARSAIGQDAAGDLIYAASVSAVPADLASVLASHGARVAWSARDP